MGLFEHFRQSSAERRVKAREENAATLFQIQESGGELWITYSDRLVCPCSMLKDEPVEAIREMRALYIKRQE